jgi:hypothetical protein
MTNLSAPLNIVVQDHSGASIVDETADASGESASGEVLDLGWVRAEMGARFDGQALQRWFISIVNRMFGASHRKGSTQ